MVWPDRVWANCPFVVKAVAGTTMTVAEALTVVPWIVA